MDAYRAYRALALAKHPDKNRGDPDAASEFAAVQKAYDVLTDEEARAALDALLRAQRQRAEERALRDGKRQRLVEELEAREAEAGRARATAGASAQLRRELDALRRAAAEKAAVAEAAAERRRRAAVLAAVDGGPVAADADELLNDKLSRTVKVTWDEKAATYTKGDLLGVFQPFGSLEEVVLRDSSRGRGRAYVVLQDLASARLAASRGDLGAPEAPLRASLLRALGPNESTAGRHPSPPDLPPWARDLPSLAGTSPSYPLFPAASSVSAPFPPGGDPAPFPAFPTYGFV